MCEMYVCEVYYIGGKEVESWGDGMERKGGKGGKRKRGGKGEEGDEKGEEKRGREEGAYLDECYPAVRKVLLHCIFVHPFPHWTITLHHL